MTLSLFVGLHFRRGVTFQQDAIKQQRRFETKHKAEMTTLADLLQYAKLAASANARIVDDHYDVTQIRQPRAEVSRWTVEGQIVERNADPCHLNNDISHWLLSSIFADLGLADGVIQCVRLILSAAHCCAALLTAGFVARGLLWRRVVQCTSGR